MDDHDYEDMKHLIERISNHVLPHVEPECRYDLVKSCMATVEEIWAARAGGLRDDELKMKLVNMIDQLRLPFLFYLTFERKKEVTEQRNTYLPKPPPWRKVQESVFPSSKRDENSCNESPPRSEVSSFER